MKNKRIILIVSILFVALIAGAIPLYNSLKPYSSSNQLITFDHQASEQPSEEPTEEPTEEPAEEPAEEPQDESNKNPAPDFTVYDINKNAIKLSDFIGKPIVLNFWASWCGPCQSEMPDFEEKYRELGDEVTFVMINLTDGARETVSNASKFVSSKGYTFPVYYDTEGNAASIYQIYSIPTTFFIDAKGNIAAQATGAIDAQTLERGINIIK